MGKGAASPGGFGPSSVLARLIARLRPEPAPPPGPLLPPPVSAPAKRQTAPPLEPGVVGEWLWGPGQVIPGSSEQILALVRPFGLTSAMTMLDISAGLGGAARIVGEAFNTYVAGLERNPLLARRGMALSVAQGMIKRAAITAYDPETYELRRSHFDGVLAREASYALEAKERFFRVLFLGLKPYAQLMLTDFVLDRSAGERPELAAWAGGQPYLPRLWTAAQYGDCLTSLGFDVRIQEDITDSYRETVLGGWSQLLRTIDLRRLPRPHLIAVVDEAERWARTLEACQSGALRVLRISAIAAPKRVDRG